MKDQNKKKVSLPLLINNKHGKNASGNKPQGKQIQNTEKDKVNKSSGLVNRADVTDDNQKKPSLNLVSPNKSNPGKKEKNEDVSKIHSFLMPIGEKSEIKKENDDLAADIEEERRLNEKNEKIDKYIMKCSESSKRSKFVSILETEFYQKLKLCSNSINNLSLSDKSKEETDKFELVEKSYMDQLKVETEEMLLNVKNIEEMHEKIKTQHFKDTAELDFKKYIYEKESKAEKNDVINKQQAEEEHIKLLEQKKILSHKLTCAKVERDDVYNTMMYFLRGYNNKLANEFISLYNSYNNESFLSSYINPDQEKIEDLLQQIKECENEIKLIESGGSRKGRKNTNRQKSIKMPPLSQPLIIK